VKGSRARAARTVSAALATGIVAASLTACGAAGKPAANAERQSAANLAGLINQLHEDLAVTQIEGDTVADARRALSNRSDQLAALVAYNDFGSCRSMVRNAGSPAGRLERVAATLTSACGLLERAAALFTQAQATGSPLALLRAADRALAAMPILYRAQVQLDAASGT